LLHGLDIAAAVSDFEPNLLVEFESVAEVEINDLDLKNQLLVGLQQILG
jgi:hypothetical protein